MKLFTTLLLAASTASSFAVAEETILVTKTITSAANVEQDLAEVLPSASVITRWEIEQSPAATVIDLIQSEPGIEIGRNGGPGTVSSIFMRGQASKNVAVFVDGVRLQTDSLGSISLLNIPTSQIDRIEILRGNMSALYGESAVGGAIHIFTKKSTNKESLSASLSYGSRNTTEFDLGLYGKSENVNYSLAINDYSTTNNSAINPQQQTSTDPDKDPFRNIAIRTQVEYTLSKSTKVGVQANKSQGTIDYDQSWDSKDYFANQNSSDISVYSLFKPTENVDTALTITQSLNNYHEFTDGVAGQPKKSKQTQVTAKNLVNLNKATLSFGVESINANYSDSTSTIDRSNLGTYIGYSGDISTNFDYQLNIRHDVIEVEKNSDKRKDNATTWLVGSGYKLSQETRLTALYSTSFAAPTPSAFSSNPNLEAETHKGYELGIQRSTQNWLGSITYFNNDSKNAVEYSNQTYTYSNISYENSGYEFSLGSSWKNTNFSINHVIQNPKDSSGETLSRRAKHYSVVKLDGYTHGYDWGVELTHSSSRDNSIWDNEILKPYTVTNVSLSREIAPNWTAKLKLENLFDADYQLAYGYDAVPFGAFLSIQYQPQ